MVETLWIPMVRGNVRVPLSSDCERLRHDARHINSMICVERVVSLGMCGGSGGIRND